MSSRRFLLASKNSELKLVELNPGGVFIFSFGAIDEAGEHSNCVMGPEVYYSSLGVSGFIKTVMAEGGVVRHLEYDQYPENHGFMVVQKGG